MWCSAGESALAIIDSVFFICITCMLLRKKSCFHTKKYIVFRSISHKILPDKSSAMPSLVRNIPICFFVSINNVYLMQCTPLSFPLPFLRSVCSNCTLMFGFCKLQKFINFSLITHQATCNN